jgi:hypothetical protein
MSIFDDARRRRRGGEATSPAISPTKDFRPGSSCSDLILPLGLTQGPALVRLPSLSRTKLGFRGLSQGVIEKMAAEEETKKKEARFFEEYRQAQ